MMRGHLFIWMLSYVLRNEKRDVMLTSIAGCVVLFMRFVKTWYVDIYIYTDIYTDIDIQHVPDLQHVDCETRPPDSKPPSCCRRSQKSPLFRVLCRQGVIVFAFFFCNITKMRPDIRPKNDHKTRPRASPMARIWHAPCYHIPRRFSLPKGTQF